MIFNDDIPSLKNHNYKLWHGTQDQKQKSPEFSESLLQVMENG